MQYVILIPLIIFFAMNMGASGFATAMAAPYGADFLNVKSASLFFTLFVFIGAITAGGRVGKTLGESIIPQHLMDVKALMIIMGAASLTLFFANILKIPQSTSQVTVGSLVGAGIHFGQINTGPFALMIPLWFLLPVLAYLTVLVFGRLIFPRVKKYLLTQRLARRYRLLRLLVVASSCWAAFAIGSNNVANAVGPMASAGLMGTAVGVLIVSPLFGLGSITLGRGPIETAGKELTPLGVLSATLVCSVSGGFLLLASILGMPASEVQIKIGAIFGMGVVRSGHRHMLSNSEVRRTALVWLVAPVLSVGVSYFLFTVFG